MAVDTPATIAILGAGPIGLEAGLYARFLGYDVQIYERGRVAENVRRWGQVRMFSPFRLNCSPLALAALSAQDTLWEPPAPDALLRGSELVDRYLMPLAKTDLLDGHVLEQTEVCAVTRRGPLTDEMVEDPEHEECPFHLLLRDRDARESTAEAEIVIVTTDAYDTPNRLGGGGLAAPGEIEASDLIQYDLPDILGSDRERYAGRHTLLFGGGHSAATSAVALSALAADAPGTQVTWITRRPASGSLGPILQIADDPFPERQRITREANRLATGGSSVVRHLGGVTVDRIERRSDGRLDVRLLGEQQGTVLVDRILAQIGYRGNDQIYAELHVHESDSGGGSLRPAAAMITSEPNFYLLGGQGPGRNTRFLAADGLSQIRDLFGVIGGRESLDLYKDAQRLL